jgi:hypothetical protein
VLIAIKTEIMSYSRLKARAATGTYIVFVFLCLPFVLPVVRVASQASALHPFDLSDLLVVFVFPLFIFLMFFWVSRFQILVSDSEFSYRSLFGGIRRLPLSQIASAKTEIGVGSSFGPFYRLVITAKDATPPLVINMKVFSQADLQKLFTILHDKVTGDTRLSVFSKNSDP